jgi:hypothetical protein
MGRFTRVLMIWIRTSKLSDTGTHHLQYYLVYTGKDMNVESISYQLMWTQVPLSFYISLPALAKTWKLVQKLWKIWTYSIIFRICTGEKKMWPWYQCTYIYETKNVNAHENHTYINLQHMGRADLKISFWWLIQWNCTNKGHNSVKSIKYYDNVM